VPQPRRNRCGRGSSAKERRIGPVTIGKIESVSVNEPKPFFTSMELSKSPSSYSAKIVYSYSVAGTLGSGTYRREFGLKDEAWEFVRDLKGKPVAVNYKPNKPSNSVLTEQSVESLLQSRAPRPPDEILTYASANAVPPFLSPFLWFFVALSAVGLIVSVWVHVAAVMGRLVVPEPFFFLIHLGIFVVWIPAIMVSKQRLGNLRRKDYWKEISKGSPEWVRYGVYGLFAYAFLNFLYFMKTQLPNGDKSGPPSAAVWRGFSGHWMVFYSVALAILYTAAKSNDNVPRCANGHPLSANSNFCTRCGASAVRN
jgi:hypothetical protein